CQQGSNWPTF
nr:immunoglobulin light chain junction region [Macaca mulatta]